MGRKLGRPRIFFAPEDITLPWRDDSACYPAIEEDPELASAWIDEGGDYADQARAICKECPVRYQCVLEALADPETEGIRAGYAFEKGGLDYHDRVALMREYGFVAHARRWTGSY